MKASNGTSAGQSGAAPNPTPAGDPRSASSRTPIVDTPPGGFPLSGPSNLPDPRTHAYRKDLADVALAGRVIASHFAEPLQRKLATAATLLAEPADNGEVIAELDAGAPLLMLDNSRGWAWGYAGEQRLVGYVHADVVL